MNSAQVSRVDRWFRPCSILGDLYYQLNRQSLCHLLFFGKGKGEGALKIGYMMDILMLHPLRIFNPFQGCILWETHIYVLCK